MAIGHLYISPYSGQTDGACCPFKTAPWSVPSKRLMGASLSSVKNAVPIPMPLAGAPTVKLLIEYFESLGESPLRKSLRDGSRQAEATEATESTQPTEVAQTAQTVEATATQTVVQADMETLTALPTADEETVQASPSEPVESRGGNDMLLSDDARIAPAVRDPSAGPSRQGVSFSVDPFTDDEEIPLPDRLALNRKNKTAALKKNKLFFLDIVERFRCANNKYLEIVAQDADPKSWTMAIDILPVAKKKIPYQVPSDNSCRIDGKTTACRTGRNERPIDEIQKANKRHNVRRETQLSRAEYALQMERAMRLFPSEAAPMAGLSAASTASNEEAVPRTNETENFSDSGNSSGDETNDSTMSDGE